MIQPLKIHTQNNALSMIFQPNWTVSIDCHFLQPLRRMATLRYTFSNPNIDRNRVCSFRLFSFGYGRSGGVQRDA